MHREPGAIGNRGEFAGKGPPGSPGIYGSLMEIAVSVIGAGSWGTTVAALASRNTPTLLWSRRSALAEQIDRDHENGDYLAGYRLPDELRATDDLERAVRSADLLVMGVPSHGFRAALESVKPYLRPWVPVISLSKGLEVGTRLRMSQLVEEVLPGHPVGVLTGPNLAKEILAGHAAASVIAMDDDNIARALSRLFQADLFRVYTNEDVVGSELGGVLKNVIAIAAGLCDGLGYGDNTKGALLTRGLAEISRLGVAMGGRRETFAGLTGMGDLITTAMSRHSRNRHVGERLGRGETLEQVLGAMVMVAEGVHTSRAARDLGRAHGVELPITEQVCAILLEGRTPREALTALMTRDLKSED